MHSCFQLSLVVVTAALCAGCGPNAQEQIDVNGQATLNGQPLEIGMVLLAPVEGGPQVSSDLRVGGVFTVYAVKPGEYRVAVNTSMYAGMAAAGKESRGGRAMPMRKLEGTFLQVPEKYESVDSSGLTVTVGEGEGLQLNLSP